MRIDTGSGLHGHLIAYRADDPEQPERGGRAVVLRDECPKVDGNYSTHDVYQDERGVWASRGYYGLTLEEAMTEINAKDEDN